MAQGEEDEAENGGAGSSQSTLVREAVTEEDVLEVVRQHSIERAWSCACPGIS